MKYQCQNCGYYSLKWLGRCPDCGAWNTFLEIEESGSESKVKRERRRKVKPLKLSEVSYETRSRISTGLEEFDLVLGGGLVPSSLILIGGDPGMGKSTLLTQTAGNLARRGMKVLYFSAEESAEQVKMRAERLGVCEDFYFASETDLEVLFELCEEITPDVVVVDSIQTVYLPELNSSPGSVSQVRECANRLLRLAKESEAVVFLVGHITKEGLIAGPKVLEHLVDTVLYLEGERETGFRILRAIKNRFGASNEIGVFVMTERGLVSQSQYEEFFISGYGAVFCLLEGVRPLLVEVQALVTRSFLATPRRQAVGVDPVRLSLLCAILEKRLGFNFGDKDVFVKVAGGLRVQDPGVDVALAVSLVGNLLEVELPARTVYIGEVGLAGELRPVRDMALRLKEAEKKGFQRAIISPMQGIKDIAGLEVLQYENLKILLRDLFRL